MFIQSTSPPFCLRVRTETILSSKIRYFDILIFSANLIFLLFLFVKSIRSRKKLTLSKPLLFSVISLLILITLTSLIRCLFTILFPHQAFADREIVLKILWLAVRLTFLWTELTLLLFGVCFGRVHSNQQSIRALKILFFSFLISTIYITIEAVLEFRDDARPIQFTTTPYNLYSYGGMKFLLISSSIFLFMYILICFLPCLCQQYRKYLPARRSFYFYCFVLALMNLAEVIGTSLNIANVTIASVCLVDGTIWIFEIFFAPFVYYQFVRRALNSQPTIPQIMYTDASINVDENDDDDDLIDPSVKPLLDSSLHEFLDGQFDEITASTRIVQPNSS